jgi:hypothetical protein
MSRRLGRRATALAVLLVAAAFAAIAGAPGPRHEARGRTVVPSRRTAPRRRGRSGRPSRGGSLVRGTAARRMTIPILMYHVIGRRPAGAPYPQLWVTPNAFRAQLAGLARRGYQATTLARVLAAWRYGGAVPRHPVVLSFDDGYRSDATIVAPHCAGTAGRECSISRSATSAQPGCRTAACGDSCTRAGRSTRTRSTIST